MAQTDRTTGLVGNAAFKVPCRVATTADITLSGLQTIDGVTVVADDRVLVKDQVTGSENGVWVVDTGAWARAPDFDGANDVVAGTIVPVYSGAGTYATYALVTDNVTIGTTAMTFELATSASLAALLAASSGSSLVGFIQAGTAAVAGTVQGELRARAINLVTQYGLSTSGTAAANRTALANAVTDHPDRALYAPAGTYSIDPSGGKITTSNLIFGDGRNKTIFSIAGNGDLFQRSAYSALIDLTINMNGATYSGHACSFAASSHSQTDRSIEILNCADTKQALLFAGDGGSKFYSDGSLYHTLSVAGTNAAVKVDGTDTSAVPRVFVGTEGNGCTIFDFGGCNDFFVYGGFTSGLIFSSTAANKLMMLGMRVGTVSGTVTVKGDSHQIKGCVFADPVVLDTDTSNVVFDSEVPSYNITNNGTANSVTRTKQSYACTWDQAAGTQPDIGDGTLVATASQQGTKVHVDIRLVAGGTTTFGNNANAYRFSVPFTAADLGHVVWGGPAFIKDNDTGAMTVCYAQIAANTSLITLTLPTGGTARLGSPITWATGDQIHIVMDYETK